MSPAGLTSDPEKLKAVGKCLLPKGKHELRNFFGLCTYYLKFKAEFANVTKQLKQFKEEKRAVQWSPKAETTLSSL
jgi:hypothetical protein